MSGVSYDILSQFAKLVNKDKKTNVETTVYGTIVEDSNGNKYVKIDGTDQLTPYTTMPSVGSTDEDNSSKNTTVAVDVNDRVSVSIKNHTATITGNMSSPAAKNSEVQEIKQFDILMADRVQAVEAVVGELDVDKLEATYAVIGDLEAAKGKITELEAADVTITGKITAANADIETLKSTKIDAAIVTAQHAEITGQLTAVNGDITNLKSANVEITGQLTAAEGEITNLKSANVEITGKLTAAEADIGVLEAKTAEIDNLKAADVEITGKLTAANAEIDKLTTDKADIDFANVKTLEGVVAIIQDLLKAGHIITEDLDAVDGNFAGYLTGVRIVGDIIEGNTIKANSLILVDDENGLYYQLNANSLGIDVVELDKEKYSTALDGSAIVEKSITAEKITVKDLVAFGAKIADFTITASNSSTGTPGSIYSGTKSGINEDNSRGIYLDSNGQFAVGDSDNFVKFYKDTNGTHKLAIQAQKITFGTGKKDVETAINDANVAANHAQSTANSVQSNLNNLEIGGRNYLLDSETEQFTAGTSRAEFLKTTFDLAPFFDDNGLIEVTLSFDAYAPVAGNLQVYCQNGSGSRYSFNKFVKVSTDWQRYSVTFTPDGPNENFVESYLAFYGTHDTGRIPHVRKLKLEKGNKATDWTPAPEDVDASISNVQATADAAQAKADAATEDLTNYISATNLALENMQGQIDGSITTWFYEVVPTTSNAPAKDWTTTDLKNIHLGDLYYDTITGYCYRWQVANNVYSWQLVKDTDVTKALEDASTAKDTADKKRQVFTATPTPPYDVGDLWVQGSAGDIMRCQTKKNASQTYAASDWVKASKYTDDTVATNAQNTATNAQNVATNAQTAANNAQADIDNLEIGGRNLALNSDEEASNNDYMFKAYSLSSPLVEGETYTATMCVTPAAGVTYYGLYLSSGYRPMGRFNVSGTEEQTISLTFTAGYAEGKTPADDLLHARNTIYRFPNDDTVTENSTIHWYKVEKGNRATDWTPAPEDTGIDFGNANALISEAQATAENAQSTADSAYEKALSNASQIEYWSGIINKVQDFCATLVIDENGTTALEQTGTGWQFNFSELRGELDKLTQETISALEYKGYISFNKDDGDPSIIIAADKTGLKLKLTASSIEFLDAANKSLVNILSSDEDGDVGLTTDRINVVEELAHDNFVWKVRENGNFGLSWKG